MTPEDDEKAFELYREGCSFREVGQMMGRDNKTIAAAVERHDRREHGLPPPHPPPPTPAQRYYDALRKIGHSGASRRPKQSKTSRGQRDYIAALEAAFDALVHVARTTLGRDRRPED